MTFALFNRSTGGYTTAWPGAPDKGVIAMMKNALTALFAAALLVSAWGYQDDRNDDTGKGEKQERIDTVRGTPPTK
jgi:hypothetical protein